MSNQSEKQGSMSTVNPDLKTSENVSASYFYNNNFTSRRESAPTAVPRNPKNQYYADGRISSIVNNTNEGDVVSEVPLSIRLDRREAFKDIFSAYFLDQLRGDNSELELTFSFRSSMAKIGSVFAATRQEGLDEILQTISSLLMQAAWEAHEKKLERDAIVGDNGNSKLNKTELDVILPFDTVRQELCRSHGMEYLFSSPTLDKAQRAISSIDYTTTLFHRILVARPEVRSNMLMGMPIDVVLSEEEALKWKPNIILSKSMKIKPIIDPSVLSPESAPLDNSFSASNRGRVPSSEQLSKLRSEHESLYTTLTGISLKEQEKALRVLQGMFITYNHQRKNAVNGALIPYAVELLQCYLQHVRAVYQKSEEERKKKLVDDLIQVGSFEVSENIPKANTGLPLPIDNNNTDDAQYEPVEIEEGITDIIIAVVDALEALCHYNPPALTRIAQTGGVHALLDVLYPFYVPSNVRAAVLDMMSVLLQEVAPFRRMRPQESSLYGQGEENGGGNDADSAFHQNLQQLSTTVYEGGVGSEAQDRLLPTMIQQALTGAYGNEGPPLYNMDRASASKFDSSAREWFSRKGLSYLVTSIMQLRTTKMIAPFDAEDAARSRQRVTRMWEKRVNDLLDAINEKSRKQ